jgi:hypothetical protein
MQYEGPIFLTFDPVGTGQEKTLDLERQKHENEKRAEELQSLREDREARKDYAFKIFCLPNQAIKLIIRNYSGYMICSPFRHYFSWLTQIGLDHAMAGRPLIRPF